MAQVWTKPVLAAAAALVFFRSIDLVVQTRITYEAPEYVWFFSSIVLPVLFLVLAGIFLLVYIYGAKHYWWQTMGDMQFWPFWYHYLFMGFMDQMFVIISTMPQPYISPVMIFGVYNVIYFFQPFITHYIDKDGREYRTSHFMGLGVIILGVALIIWQQVEVGWTQQGVVGNGASTLAWEWGMVGVYMTSFVFLAISYGYKDVMFKRYKMDIFAGQFYLTVFQFVVGLCTLWIIYLPWPAPAVTLVGKDLGQYTKDCIACFAGTMPEVCGDNMGWWTLAFGVINVVFNMLLLYFSAKHSATMSWVLSALRTPIGIMLLGVPWLTGAAYTHNLRWQVFVSLPIFVVGAVLYGYKAEQHADGTPVITTSTAAVPLLAARRNSCC